MADRKLARDDRWLTAPASLAVGTAFFALWFWLLPQWLGFRVDTAGVARWPWLAAVPSVLGFAVALRCVWDFGWTGRGTPAPMAPPQRLVVVGVYRYVRNPMYLGFAVGWIGLWIVFGHASACLSLSWWPLPWVCICSWSFTKSQSCDVYCRNVRRWWPRVQGWNN